MISVIVCTRNPRRDFLSRTLNALRGQTLDPAGWDLLIVDNGSEVPLETDVLEGWHSRARLIREEERGLVFARLRGIEESKGEYLVFVDDDNVLEAGYLQEVMRISIQHPTLGAFGAGRIEAEFEGTAPRLPRFVREQLTLRAHRRPMCSRELSPRTCPSGAGMVVRRSVAQLYLEKVRSGGWTLATLLRQLGIPVSTPGANDFDLGYQAVFLNLEMGVFPSLMLTHLINVERTREDYLLWLVRNNARATALLAYVYSDGRLPRRRLPRAESLARLLTTIRGRGKDFRYRLEWWKGEVDAHQLLQEHRSELEKLHSRQA
jgi:glycosyltransferase involved in cell wall biosynthesis